MNLKKALFMTAVSSTLTAAPAFAKPHGDIFTKPGRQCGQFQKPGVCQQENEQEREVCVQAVLENNRRVAECLRNRHGVSPETFDLLFSNDEESI